MCDKSHIKGVNLKTTNISNVFLKTAMKLSIMDERW
jgi:hypothetical protein